MALDQSLGEQIEVTSWTVVCSERSRNIIKLFYDIPWSFSPTVHKWTFVKEHNIYGLGKIIKNFMMTVWIFQDFLRFWKLLIYACQYHKMISWWDYLCYKLSLTVHWDIVIMIKGLNVHMIKNIYLDMNNSLFVFFSSTSRNYDKV